jgi:hypothetical protein
MSFLNYKLHSFFRITFLCFIVLCKTIIAYSQSITPVDLNSGGTEIIENDIYLTFTVGGVAVNTISKDTFYLTQGYQQVDISSSAIITIDHINIATFPNPCVSYVYISLKNFTEIANCSIEILSSSGKESKIISNKLFIRDIPTKIGLVELEAGLYIVKITNKGTNNILGCFKILKLNELK